MSWGLEEDIVGCTGVQEMRSKKVILLLYVFEVDFDFQRRIFRQAKDIDTMCRGGLSKF